MTTDDESDVSGTDDDEEETPVVARKAGPERAYTEDDVRKGLRTMRAH